MVAILNNCVNKLSEDPDPITMLTGEMAKSEKIIHDCSLHHIGGLGLDLLLLFSFVSVFVLHSLELYDLQVQAEAVLCMALCDSRTTKHVHGFRRPLVHRVGSHRLRVKRALAR